MIGPISVGFPCRDEVERRPTVLSVCRDLGKMTCGYHINLTIVGRQEPRIKWNYGRFEPFTTGSTIDSLVLDGFSIHQYIHLSGSTNLTICDTVQTPKIELNKNWRCTSSDHKVLRLGISKSLWSLGGWVHQPHLSTQIIREIRNQKTITRLITFPYFPSLKVPFFPYFASKPFQMTRFDELPPGINPFNPFTNPLLGDSGGEVSG